VVGLKPEEWSLSLLEDLRLCVQQRVLLPLLPPLLLTRLLISSRRWLFWLKDALHVLLTLGLITPTSGSSDRSGGGGGGTTTTTGGGGGSTNDPLGRDGGDDMMKVSRW